MLRLAHEAEENERFNAWAVAEMFKKTCFPALYISLTFARFIEANQRHGPSPDLNKVHQCQHERPMNGK